jgi:hypothetical protein
MRIRHRQAALVAALVAGLALAVVACGGSSKSSKPIPASDAQALQRQLSSVESRFNVGGGACNDIFEGSDPNEGPVDSTISSLPPGTDSGVRHALTQSFDRLFELVRKQCKKPAPKPTTSTTQTRTTPPPTTSTTPTTETTTTPTTQTTTQPAKPGKGKTTGNGGNTGRGNGGGDNRNGDNGNGGGGNSGEGSGGRGGGDSGGRGSGRGGSSGDGGTTTPGGGG